MHAVRTSIEDNERMVTACKGCMLAAVLADKKSPWPANKCGDKDASIERSGRRNSRFKISNSYMFSTMCQLTSSSYIEPM